MQFSTLTTRPDTSAQTSTPDTTTSGQVPAGRRPGRRLLAVVAGAGALVLAGAGTAVAAAHKDVHLDVDGATTTVSTFAGSVAGLLDQRHVHVGSHDLVSAAGALHDGQTVVVRHAHTVTVTVGGHRRTVWTTALSADEALDTLATRDSDVALVASRSAADGRFDLTLDLALDGPATVLVDGSTRPVPDASVTVGAALTALGITLNPLDEVTVRQVGGTVQVVVARVVQQDVTVTGQVAYASSTTNDATRSVGTRTVVTRGVPGVRTQVQQVTTVDGVERSRVTLSDQVTTAPVDEVVAIGSQPRPRPSTRTSSAAVPSAASGGLDWAALAACESGGDPAAVSASGTYFGLYQFSVSTWRAVGGSGLPSQASAAEQTARAQLLYARSGAGQWPVCGKRL